MRDEYDIEKLNPRKNPYYELLQHKMTVDIEDENYYYFDQISKDVGIPIPKLINLYLADCIKKRLRPDVSWN